MESAMPIYMKFEGIDGSVTAKGFEKWVELRSCMVGVSRTITNPTGRGTNREAGVPQISELVVTKHQDEASVGLFKASLWGEGKKVKIDFVKTDKDKFESYLQVELENAIVSKFTASGHGGDSNSRAIEELHLNFTKITYHSIAMDHTNKTARVDRAMWDAAQGRG
jgi:type VI secretion system secreted protein Hcp